MCFERKTQQNIFTNFLLSLYQKPYQFMTEALSVRVNYINSYLNFDGKRFSNVLPVSQTLEFLHQNLNDLKEDAQTRFFLQTTLGF